MTARTVASVEARVAVLVDCDNTSPEILEYALRVVAQFGRVVLRRGYGNYATLANKWQETLVRLAFTPCLQYQYATGKNTSDIALALDALEALFDQRADTFCLVTSDSDFAYLCRKLRERGATVHIVGEAKTPDPLRNATRCRHACPTAHRQATQHPHESPEHLTGPECELCCSAGWPGDGHRDRAAAQFDLQVRHRRRRGAG